MTPKKTSQPKDITLEDAKEAAVGAAAELVNKALYTPKSTKHSFEFHEITFKGKWSLTLVVNGMADQELKDKYKIRFFYNEEPHEEAIDLLNSKIYELEHRPQLLNDEMAASLDEIQKKIEEEEKSVIRGREEFKDIELYGVVKEMKVDYPSKVIKFIVPMMPQVIAELAKATSSAFNYKVELTEF